MVDIVAQASVEADAIDVEVRERLDSLHENLQQAKTLNSINPQQAENIYKSLCLVWSLGLQLRLARNSTSRSKRAHREWGPFNKMPTKDTHQRCDTK